MKRLPCALLIASLMGLAGPAAAEDKAPPCRFDASVLSFAGTASGQARCLLREVLPGGRVALEEAVLPPALQAWIDRPTGHWKSALRQLLRREGRSELSLGGPLDQGVSVARTPDGRPWPARYFVVHDTSWPLLHAPAFPLRETFEVNDLGAYAHPTTAVAHVFVNRLGQTFAPHGLEEPWRATKLELQLVGEAAKGRFLHIELLQPRRRDPDLPGDNDALAPQPGFTAAQYEALALLYAAASVRAGRGLIPAQHAVIDEGLPQAHDDPQHFELAAFGEALARLTAQLDLPGRRGPGRGAAVVGR